MAKIEKNIEEAPKAEVPKAEAPKAEVPKAEAPKAVNVMTLENKFNALCKHLGVSFKQDAGRVIAIK